MGWGGFERSGFRSHPHGFVLFCFCPDPHDKKNFLYSCHLGPRETPPHPVNSTSC